MYHFNTEELFPASAAPVQPSPIGRVLVIEEDMKIRDAILNHLRDRQWTAVAGDRREIARHLQCKQLSLVTLNAQLGAVSGLDVLRQIRARSYVPVIMYHRGADDDVNRIVGLELGADDFICGALNLHELVARARAILRRQDLGRLIVQPLRGGYRFAGWELRHASRTLTSPAGKVVVLTKKEYALLNALLESPGRPLSRMHLMLATRAHEDIFDRSVDVQVLRLRRKLAADASGKELIKTERGFGYTMDAVVEPLF